jgi:hypothetical protein
MNLIDVPQFELVEPRLGPRPNSAPDDDRAPGADRPAVYTLAYHDPDTPGAGHPVGWTLVARYDMGWCWSTSLGARGAGAHAAARVAQAVAVRVLTEQGVAVEGWSDPEHGNTSDDQTPAIVSFRARPVVPAPSASSPRPQAHPWLRRIVCRQLQGH